MFPISLLELGRVREGQGRRQALLESIDVAKHVEQLGFQRIWVAEHHNIPTVSTAATSVLLGLMGQATSTIRIGAGGIMLPNHAPYVIAEQFGTLAELFPGRVDLGLGRAPGTDQATLRALRRDPMNSENFPQDVLELQLFLSDKQPGQRIEAIPGSGTNVPLWILGSSLFGAQLAAELGLPYGFASHFAPQALMSALQIYRRNFKPSAQCEQPYALIGVNIIAAETDEEARYLATSQQMTFADLVRGQRGLFSPPIDDIETYWSPAEKTQAGQMLSCAIIGGPATVKAGIEQLLLRTQADELMVVSDLYESSKRYRSLEIIAEAARAVRETALV